MIPPPPVSTRTYTLFPYTTLSRSRGDRACLGLRGQLGNRPAIVGHPFDAERRHRGDHRRTALRKAVEAERHAERIGERAENAPVLARVAGCEHRLLAALDAAFGVDRGEVLPIGSASCGERVFQFGSISGAAVTFKK